MTQFFEIPLKPKAQTFNVKLSGNNYNMALKWNVPAACWLLDLFDDKNVLLAGSLPLLGGADMLAQYDYLGIGGALIAMTDGAVDTAPTFENLGITSHLYYVTP